MLSNVITFLDHPSLMRASGKSCPPSYRFVCHVDRRLVLSQASFVSFFLHEQLRLCAGTGAYLDYKDLLVACLLNAAATC